jgi:uncharacterized protein YydD (DUF2326 family)
MEIFALDLMLAQLWSERTPGPRVLIHDSALFDGVDERQVAQAVERAAAEAERCGFIYLCTMNSDSLPVEEFSEGFSVDRYVRARLTDESPAGSLLGMRYE